MTILIGYGTTVVKHSVVYNCKIKIYCVLLVPKRFNYFWYGFMKGLFKNAFIFTDCVEAN